jgi:serine/threonine protein kinase
VEPLDPKRDPTRIGPFVLLGRLGAGGMGRVYLGRSPGGREVAVKVIHQHLLDGDSTFRSRFRHEVEAAKRVGGFYTAAIVESDADGDPPWYASAYIDAPTLHDLMVRDGPLRAHRARALGAGLAEALQAIHAAGLVHRDLKPSNVLMASDGPRVIDFGIVRLADAGTALTGTGMRLGTIGYLSPEQLHGAR